MPIRLEYIVSNRKGIELKRFDVKTEAEAYDSVICAAEEIGFLIQPLQKKLSLTDEQIEAIAEHLAFQSEEVKLAFKQIKKPKAAIPDIINDAGQDNPAESDDGVSEVKSTVKKGVVKKSASRQSGKKK